MSILDEDKRNFTNNGKRYIYYLNFIRKWLPNSRVLVSRCVGVPCPRCIGHKYNINNGCPVCGEAYVYEITDGWDRHLYDAVHSVHRCFNCGSIITSCGCGDVTAVGIAVANLRTSEDIV